MSPKAVRGFVVLFSIQFFFSKLCANGASKVRISVIVNPFGRDREEYIVMVVFYCLHDSFE